LYRLAEVDLDGLKNKGNTPRAEERIGLGLSTKLLANARHQAHATRLEEANCGSVKVSRDSQEVYGQYAPYLTLLTCLAIGKQVIGNE
jgi:hypothetical protein